MGEKHQNGLAMIPEVEIKPSINQKIPNLLNQQQQLLNPITLPTKKILNIGETDDSFLRSEILELLKNINRNFCSIKNYKSP